MAHIYVGDMVMVRGLTNKQTYNGRLGLVKQLISSVPENKCQIQLSYCGALEDKHLILKTRCLSLVAPGHRYYPESVPCQSMVWGLAAAKAAKVWCPADHQVDQRPWVHRVAAQDSWELTLSKMDVWYYCIRKLAQLIRRGNHIGQAARSFQPRQVRDLHYGYVWSHGGKEQATEFPTSGSVADIMAAGSDWWPVIWVDVGGGSLVPVYCPGLAWANARPWMAHCTRIREVETPGCIIEELDPDCAIIQVA